MDNENDPQQLTSSQPGLFAKLKFSLAKNKFIIIFILILCLISFGATGYLLIASQKTSLPNKSFQNNVTSTSYATPSPPIKISITSLPTPTPAVNLVSETATWSAFASTKYSYSIKYPPSWTAQITASTDPKILEYVVFNPVATKAGTLSITLSYGTRTYLEALDLDPQTGKNITIASVSATKKTSKDSNGYKATNIIVPFGSNSIIFNAKDTYANLFNQMLSTLKLTK